MAIRYAVANGFADVASTWDGGTLPSATDDLYSNNFVVSIRSDLTANSLKKIAGGAAVAGGSFLITAACTVTITAGIASTDNQTSSSYLLGVSAGSGAVTITTPSIAGGSTGSRLGVSIGAGQNGTVTINANITGGSSSGCYGVVSAAVAGALVINGNITGTGFTGGAALQFLSASGTVSVTGNILGGAGASAHGVSVQSSSIVMTVTGDVTGGSTASSGIGIDLVTSSSLTLTVTGSATGGSTGNPGVNVASGTALNFTGNTLGGSVASGINVASGGAATIRGTHTGSTGAAAISSSGFCRVSGTLIHASANSRAPITGNWAVIAGEETEMRLYTDSAFPASNVGTAVTLSLYGTDNPDEADVREGVAYGASGTLVGTLAVPDPDAVTVGVPTDGTVGTAYVSAQQFAAMVGAQIAAAANIVGGPQTVVLPAIIRDETVWPYSYTGRAPEGTADSDGGWRIVRLTLDVTPIVTEYAVGSWDDRAILTYAPEP